MTTIAQTNAGSAPGPRERAPWIYLICCWAYFLICFHGIFRATPIFKSLFQGLGMELPMATRFLLASYWWLCPLLFISIVALTLAKQFHEFEKRHARIINVYLVAVALLAGPAMVFLLYLPLLELIHKLSDAR